MPSYRFFSLAIVLVLALGIPSESTSTTLGHLWLTISAACSLPLLACWWASQLAALSIADRSAGIRHAERALWLLWLVVGLAVVLLVQWPQAVRGWSETFGSRLVADLCILAPLVLPLWLSRWAFGRALIRNEDKVSYSAHNASLWQASLSSRFELVALVLPMIVVIGFWPMAETGGGDSVDWLAGGMLVLGLIGVYPMLLRWAWRLQKLPPGKLQQGLREVAASGSRLQPKVYMWPQGSNVAAAAAIGGLPSGVVVLGDWLVQRMPVATVQVVFAHELAHLRRFHVAWRLLSVVALWPLIWAGQRLNLIEPWALISFGMVGTAWLLMQTARLLEHDADLFAAEMLHDRRSTGSVEEIVSQFGSALHAMASPRELNRGGWLHPSVAVRVAFLARCLNSPAAKRRFHLRRRLHLAALVTICVVAIAAAISV